MLRRALLFVCYAALSRSSPIIKNASENASRQPSWTIQHDGGINGFSTVILRYPDQDTCVIVLSNMPSPRFGSIGHRLAMMLLDDSSME